MAGQVLVAGWSGRAHAITTWPVRWPLSGASDLGLYPVVIAPDIVLPWVRAGRTHTRLNTHIMTSAFAIVLTGLALLYVVWVFTHGDRG